jgi:hypothetical protein
LQTSTFILKIIFDLIFYEAVWFFIKTSRVKLQTLKWAMKFLIFLNIFFLVVAANVTTFVNLYFLLLWYFVIYPDRIANELTEQQAKGETHDEVH